MEYAHLVEKQISREEIFEGSVLHIVKDRVLLPNGGEADREMCLHRGAVAILPLLSTGEVLMERQYRYAHGRVFFEIPAGKLERGEAADPLEAAKRELLEETGAIANKYTDLGVMIPSCAVLSERIYLYLAEDISFAECARDFDEFLDLERVPLAALYEDALAGRIEDGKTLVAVLKVAHLRGKDFGIRL